MEKNKGAAVSEPQIDVDGSRIVTSITNLCLSTGAKPTNEAIVFEAS